MRAAKVQASLRIRAVSPEPSLLAHTSSESRGTFRQKARSLAPLNGWTCAVKICHDGMLEDTNSLDGAHFIAVHAQCKSWDPVAEEILPYICDITLPILAGILHSGLDSRHGSYSKILVRWVGFWWSSTLLHPQDLCLAYPLVRPSPGFWKWIVWLLRKEHTCSMIQWDAFKCTISPRASTLGMRA